MQKITKFIVAFAIMLIAIPLGGNIVKADDALEEGEYTIEVEALHAKEDKASGTASFIKDKALLEVSKDKIMLTLSVDHETITGLQIENKDELIEPKDEKISEDKETRDITYELDEFHQIMNGKVQYVAEYPGGIHKGDQPFRLKSDISDLPLKSDEPNEDPNEDPKEDPKEEPSEIQLEPNDVAKSVEKGQIIKIKGDENFQLKMPNSKGFPDNVELTIKRVNEDNVKTDRTIEVAGEVYEFNFEGLGNYDGEFELVMTYDADEYDAEEVDIYYYNADEKKWEAQNGVAKDGKITVGVNHFSTYGVMADTSETSLLKPDKAYEIKYNIMKDDGSGPSISSDFFSDIAYLFEKDGKKYVQLKIENGDMIKSLGNDYGKALIVEKNDDDGTVIVQLRVNNNLSDMVLNMHIVVPGGAIPGFPGYNQEHDAILVFDKGSQKEIAIGNHMLIGTNNSDNENGIYVEGESSKELGGEGENPVETPTPETDETLNPKTGDSNNIALYVFLLIGSLIPLGFLYKNRRFN